MSAYVASVGMEVHAELMTRSKMFCRCPVAFGGEPNTRVCPVCMGLPGALPVPNREAIDMVLRAALALNCTIAAPDNEYRKSVFHRKNYFYPDLPKGYQVSQYGEDNPIGHAGWIDVPTAAGGVRRVKIRRVHLEEDTGKLMHLPSGGSGVDYNRAGVPLMEIVTDFPPDITNPEEAKEYLVQLRQILVYLGVCDGKMEEGSLRCEPNISVRPEGSNHYGTKTELKNLNSFRSVQLGVQYEVSRQIEVIESGGVVHQETRGWNEQTEASFVMRVKEAENDYRYFPDPDLTPLRFDEAWIESARASLPELPLAKLHRYQQELGLSSYDASVLVAERPWAEWFERCVELGGSPKPICNWMNGDFARLLNESGLTAEASKIKPEHLVDLTAMIESNEISGKIAKEVFEDVFTTGQSPRSIVQAKGLTQVSDLDTLLKLVDQVLEGHPEIVAKYKAGQTNVAGFLIGQVMKLSDGRANPQMARTLVSSALEKL